MGAEKPERSKKIIGGCLLSMFSFCNPSHHIFSIDNMIINFYKQTKTLRIGAVAFLPGAQRAEELQGTHPEHKKASQLKPEIVQTQWRR